MEESIYKNAKILVVDDIEEVLNSTKNSLKFEGMNVETSNNPIEALEYLKNNKVDVILLDFFMPQMNGDKFIEKLREFNSETVIILRTGYSDKVPPMEMIDSLNIQGYIDKLKGEDELLLMTKSAIKTSYLYKQIIDKDKEIAKLHYKNAIKGNLIVKLVNEAKDQLMQIGIMNGCIESETQDFNTETSAIKVALEKTQKLYEALNFDMLENITLSNLVEIIEILTKPILLLNNAFLTFDSSENNYIFKTENNVIYVIIKIVEILTANDVKNIKITAKNELGNLVLESTFEKEISSDKMKELELLMEKNKFEIETNKIKLYV